ncbi:MAG: NUDIX hydrolase [Acidimicrobiia bacterium]
MTDVIRAAGGLIFRRTEKGTLKVLIAHRPSYDDWGLPKGKADRGETSEQTALREVREETGLDCRIVAPLETTRHRINAGIKEVAWFAMRPLPSSPGFKKNDEIDQIKWVTRKKAKDILDYQTERDLVANAALKSLAQTGTIYLLRHGTAGNRSKWNDDDRIRPLTRKGERQAMALAGYLEDKGIERIVTSPYLRCVATVEGLAKEIGATVEISAALAEGPDIDAAYELVDSLVGHNAVLCSHGDVIPAVMNRLMWAGLTLESRFYCSKASIWEVGVAGGRFTTASYVAPPKV